MSGGKKTSPLSLEQVAELLRQATEAVTQGNQRTAETVMAMREEDLRSDPVLGAAFRRGWAACVAAMNLAVRVPATDAKRQRTSGKAHPPPKPPKPTRPATQPKASTSTPSKPSPPGAGAVKTPGTPRVVGKIPPLPSQWSDEEKNRALRYNPLARYIPSNVAVGSRPPTSKGSRSQQATGSDGTPDKNRKAPSEPVAITGDGVVTGKQRKWERFLRIKAARKAKKDRSAVTSQQHRLAKHPVPLEAPTATAQPTCTTEEPMETDVGGTGAAATPGTPRDEVKAGKSGRDVIDVYLESPLPSLPELDEEIPGFETPLTSPRQNP